MTKDIKGILWLFGAVFLFLCLYSYNPLDPSFNSISSNLGKIHNMCGIVGSFLSDALLQIFGVAAWVFVLFFLRCAVLSFKGYELRATKSNVLICIVLLATLPSICSLYLPSSPYGLNILTGGVVGLLVSNGLVNILNPLGAGVVLWTFFCIFIIFYGGRSLTFNLFRSTYKFLYSVIFNVLYFFGASRLVFYFKQKFQKPKDIQSYSDLRGDYDVFDIEKEKVKNSCIPKSQENWLFPKLGMLSSATTARVRIDDHTIKRSISILENKLNQFAVKGVVVSVKSGPAVTLYEFKPEVNVKISKITDLADDLSLALSAESVRIIAPLPGRDVVGIETSNPNRDIVYLKDILEDSSFWDEGKSLPLVMGKSVNGSCQAIDLRKIPHLLVAGTTGSGKSVFVVSIITGLLFRHSPKTMRLILIDPKQVDLSVFHNIPHLLMPPIKDVSQAVVSLKWAISEMEKRYRSMSEFGVRDLDSFNKVVSKLSESEKVHYEKINQEPKFYYTKQPYIVIVIEEFGDLMAVDKANVQHLVVRLAQMARACGIHLILSVQSPRRDVVTGLIKTNIPGRISFKVASKIDSRIILDESGGERLLAKGDMLFIAPGIGKPVRYHGPWVNETDVEKIATFWEQQSEDEYDPVAVDMLNQSSSENGMSYFNSFDKDSMYDEALEFVQSQTEVSVSMLQRKFRLGYPRAARIIETFEKKGIVSVPQGSKPRQVLKQQ